jgi:hypothetical protein
MAWNNSQKSPPKKAFGKRMSVGWKRGVRSAPCVIRRQVPEWDETIADWMYSAAMDQLVEQAGSVVVKFEEWSISKGRWEVTYER